MAFLFDPVRRYFQPIPDATAAAAPVPAATAGARAKTARPNSAPVVTRLDPRLRAFERRVRSLVTRDRIAIAVLVLVVILLSWSTIALLVKSRKK